MKFKANEQVTHPDFKAPLTICSQVNKEWYLCYSTKLRHSVVLNVKELKRI